MSEEGFMLAVLKGIPLIQDIKAEGTIPIMTIDGILPEEKFSQKHFLFLCS